MSASASPAVSPRSRTPRGGASAPFGVRLEWPGRQWRREATESEVSVPQARRVPVGVDVTGDGRHRLVHGDALDLARLLAAEGMGGKVDLVYVDPPYASDRDYVAESRLDGPADGRVVRTPAYEDTWALRSGGVGAYLDMLAPRLEALAGLLGPRGTLWVHLDWRAAYLVRSLLDEILGRDAFKNEIVWRRAPNLGRQATSGQFGRTLDTLVVYGMKDATLVPPTRLEPVEESAIRWDPEGRPFTSAPRGDYTDASIERLEAEGRVHRTASGRVYIKYFLVKDRDGTWCRERRVDALWTDVPPLRHVSAAERTGYPTQKPRALLERIIACASPEGGLVVDAFAGSGTTALAAHALGRRAVVGDRSAVAIATARSRLLRADAGVRIERLEGTPPPPATEVRLEPGESPRTVRLAAPEEPLAWALGALEDGVFVCAWHSERSLGQRSSPVAREAPIPSCESPFARVWGDDGSVTTVPVCA